MSELLPVAKVGKTEYNDNSFRTIGPYFSDSFTATVHNSTDNSTLIVGLVINYIRFANHITCYIPRINIADIGVAGYLYIRGPWPVPVQSFIDGNTQIGFGFLQYNSGPFLPAGMLLQQPNNNPFVFVNTGAIGGAANSDVNLAAMTVNYFVRP